MWVYANEGFYALAGFAKVVGAIDGSSVPIITPINVSVHPPHETVDRVDPPRHRASRAISLRSFFFCFVAFGQYVHFIFNSNSPMHYYLPLLRMITLIMLKLNFRKYTVIHTNYITPKSPLYNIIIIVDTVFRQRRNVKHEKQLCQQYRHIDTLACMIKACRPSG